MSTPQTAHRPPAALARRPPGGWTLIDEHAAVRVIVRGAFGPDDAAALDARLATHGHASAPVVIDLTAVTRVHPRAVDWLGARHESFGLERPLLVVVVADGPLHARLTEPTAPRLRLTLV